MTLLWYTSIRTHVGQNLFATFERFLHIELFRSPFFIAVIGFFFLALLGADGNTACVCVCAVSVCACARARQRLLISTFAKWSESAPSALCTLGLCLLPPEPTCAYVWGCFNFCAHNWDETQGSPHPLGQHCKHTALFSIPPSLPLDPSILLSARKRHSLPSQTFRKNTKTRINWSNSQTFQNQEGRKEALNPTLGSQSRTKNRKLLRAPPPPPLFHQWREKKYINKTITCTWGGKVFEDRGCVGLWGKVGAGARSSPTLHQREE